jgi:hypothetical protein
VPNLRAESLEGVRLTSLVSEGFQVYYCVPLVAKGQTKGVIEIFHRDTLQTDPEWLDLVTADVMEQVDGTAMERDYDYSAVRHRADLLPTWRVQWDGQTYEMIGAPALLIDDMQNRRVKFWCGVVGHG